MSPQLTITWTTRVAQSAFIVLILVVATAVFIGIFDLTPFGKRTTETLFIIIPVLIALIGGSVLLNVIANLNVISSAMVKATTTTETNSELTLSSTLLFKRFSYLIGIPLLALFGLAFMGDRLTKYQKEKLLLADAQTTATQFQSDLDRISKAPWDAVFVNQVTQTLKLMSKQNKNFPSVNLILSDTVDGKNVYLRFGNYSDIDSSKTPVKVDYIFSTDSQERDYLQKVFQQKTNNYRYTAFDGQHELFYPIKMGNQPAVLLFSERSSYGKLGS